MGMSPKPKTKRNHELYKEWKSVDTEGKRVQTVDQIIRSYNKQNPDETIKRKRFYVIVNQIDKDPVLRIKLIAEANPHLTQAQVEQYQL